MNQYAAGIALCGSQRPDPEERLLQRFRCRDTPGLYQAVGLKQLLEGGADLIPRPAARLPHVSLHLPTQISMRAVPLQNTHQHVFALQCQPDTDQRFRDRADQRHRALAGVEEVWQLGQRIADSPLRHLVDPLPAVHLRQRAHAGPNLLQPDPLFRRHKTGQLLELLRQHAQSPPNPRG